MDHIRRAALYTWNTPILRVPVGLALLCAFVYRNSDAFTPTIAKMRAKHGDTATDRVLNTAYGLTWILILANLINAAAETCNDRCAH